MEFEEKYKDTEIDPTGLIMNWSSYRKQLERALADHGKKEFETEWDSIVHNFFILIQLFPSKQVGRNVTASSANFEASVRKLIQFEIVIYFLVFMISVILFMCCSYQSCVISDVYTARSNGCHIKKLSNYRCLWKFRKGNQLLLLEAGR